MTKKYIVKACLAILMAGGLSGCLKNVDAIDSNIADVTFNNSGAKYVTADVTLNPKDSIFFDYTVTCVKNMKYVSIQKNGADIIRDTLTVAARNQYAAVKKLMADSIPGVYTYSVVAKDTGGTYLGSANIKVTINSDFVYYVDRRLSVPDTVAKTNKAYLSLSSGKLYSFSDGAANSASIDLGYFYDTTTASKHTIYALTTNPVSFYDISSWTKNATIFKRVTTPTFASLTSGGALKTAGLANLGSGTAAKITALVAGNVILFKTAAGKYGAINVNYVSGDSPASTTFMSVDIKIQP